MVSFSGSPNKKSKRDSFNKPEEGSFHSPVASFKQRKPGSTLRPQSTPAGINRTPYSSLKWTPKPPLSRQASDTIRTITDHVFRDLRELKKLQDQKKLDEQNKEELTYIPLFDSVRYKRVHNRVLFCHFSTKRDKLSTARLEYSERSEIERSNEDRLWALFLVNLSSTIDINDIDVKTCISRSIETTATNFWESVLSSETTDKQEMIDGFSTYLHRRIEEEEYARVLHTLMVNDAELASVIEKTIINSDPVQWYKKKKDEASNFCIRKNHHNAHNDYLLNLIKLELDHLSEQYQKAHSTIVLPTDITAEKIYAWLVDLNDQYERDKYSFEPNQHEQNAIKTIYADYKDDNSSSMAPTSREALKKVINETRLRNYQQRAKEYYFQTVIESEKAQQLTIQHQDDFEQIERSYTQCSTHKENSVTPHSTDEIIAINETKNRKTLLSDALALGDFEIIDAVLMYAEHLDTGPDDLPNGLTNKLTLIQTTLHEIIDGNGSIKNTKAFLYLINLPFFADSELVKKMRIERDGSINFGSPSPSEKLLFSSVFDTQNRIKKALISAQLEKAEPNVIADLIPRATHDVHLLLIAEIKRRYNLSNINSAATVDFPLSILQALKKRAAKTERFEYLTNLFAKALSHICQNYQGQYSEHYKEKLNVILKHIQQKPNENIEHDLLEQAEKIAEDILKDKNTTETNLRHSNEDILNENNSIETKKKPILYQYRDNSSFHVFAPKTVNLIKTAVNPSCSLGLISNKSPKILPVNDKAPIDYEQIVNVKKSEIELLIDKGSRTEEAQKRAILAAHVFENTLRYLNKRSKSRFEKIMDTCLSSKPTPQALLNNLENNDPKYKALMGLINEFIHSEQPNAAEILFAKLNDAKSDVGKVLYNTNWPFVTFKAQTFRRLKKDEEKKGSLVPTITV